MLECGSNLSWQMPPTYLKCLIFKTKPRRVSGTTCAVNRDDKSKQEKLHWGFPGSDLVSVDFINFNKQFQSCRKTKRKM